MNAINRATTKLFDLLLVPLEALGNEWAILIMSGAFGVLALWIFKHISSQKGIRAAKDKIKGHMIEIRLYQDDLGLVSKAIGKVLLRNLQYVVLNFGPFIPLSIPFVLVLAQMVTRYGYEPVPVVENPSALMAGSGTTLRIDFKDDQRAAAGELELVLPDGLVAVSPLVRSAGQGKAFQEFVATRGGRHEIVLRAGGQEIIKYYDAGPEAQDERHRQGKRVSGLTALLFPVEDTAGGEPFAEVAFEYPPSNLGWLPGSGELGIVLVFLVASMFFGILALKPLGVTI